jgi:NADP-dependent 3-hydroxy acid dehydrogenase YdfG
MTTYADAGDGRPVAVVTGASSGIGAATARRLTAEGFHVIAAARREDRLRELASEIGCTPVALDVTDEDSVAALGKLAGELAPRVRILVNNAGGAFGLDPVEAGDVEQWRAMYDVNVLGTLRVTQALVPALVASGQGHVVNVTSIAGHMVYEGGAGYTAAKHAQRALGETLRLELNGRPVRVTEIAPGMVRTDEFSLVRFGGDADRAASVYDGVAEPLVAEDIADCIAFAVTRPRHVDVDLLVVRPLAQASPTKVHREPVVRPDEAGR